MRDVRRGAGLVAGAALLALLAGCVGIPTSGDVHQSNPAGLEESIELDVFADGPEPDAEPAEILRGFIAAAASPRNYYEVARLFLTDGFEWRPEERVTIDAGPETRNFESIAEDVTRVTVTPTGEVGPTGEYRAAESPSTVPLEYHFEQVDGQWRISRAPQGILIDDATFSQVFTKQALYFYDPDYRYLVPDLRWFPRRESTQTSIVRELLRGPSEWLAPGVVSAFPENTVLSSDAVPVSSGVATIDLEGASSDDLLVLQRMELQLRKSLGSVRSIREVAIAINGIVEEIPDLPRPPSDVQRVDPRALVANADGFGFLSLQSGEIEEIPSLSPTVVALEPRGATLGVGASAVAVLGEDGVSVVRPGAGAVLLDEREGLLVPAIDDPGIVWSVPADEPGALAWFAPDGAEGGIDPRWPDGSRIVSLDVSRDGTRMLALLEGGGRTHFFVAAIERGEGGVPIRFGTVETLASVAGEARDGAWLDSINVAALTAVDGGETVVTTQEIGGRSSARAGAVDGVTMVGGNTQREARILTSDGELNTQSGLGWQARAGGIRFLAGQQGQ